TIDSRLQKYAEDATKEHMTKLQAEFFKAWDGKNPWRDERGREIEGFLDRLIKNSERYKALQETFGTDTVKILKEMEKPVKMKVFTWDNLKFEKDTVLSPIDSIRYYKHFLHIGMMAMNPNTGEVKAWVGGINHAHFQFDHVKQGRRQPGSTFKPIVYAAAISEKKFHPCYKVLDIPTTFTLPSGGTWTARNSGPYTSQEYTLRQALGRSINTIAAYLIKEVGTGQVIKYARNMGITSPLDSVPALSLGVSDVSVYDLVGAYATFVNQGIWTEPKFIVKITDKNGKVLDIFSPRTKEVFSPQDAYTMTYMLRGSSEESGGTAGRLWRYDFRKNNEVGGKTGTTQNYSDGWFVGFTKDLVTGVWVGGDSRSIHFQSYSQGQGSYLALPAFAEFYEKVYADSTLGYEKGGFIKPNNMEVELNCSKYQRSASDSTHYVSPKRHEDEYY
ncbi:MAG: penicillin-binding protein, partial [Bernardetiaceae bacterium]|nr:penicillin-binding protein [Bernardetiaceae bacterium]